MGPGLAAHSHDATSQSRRQQLLDVRHRPLRLSLGGRRHPSSPPVDARAHGPRADGVARRRAAPTRRHSVGRRGRRRIGSVPRVGACGHRGIVRVEADGRSPAGSRWPVVGLHQLEPSREATAGRRGVQGQRHRRTQRERRPRPGLRGRPAGTTGRRTSPRYAPMSKVDASKRYTSSIRDRTARSATSRGLWPLAAAAHCRC